MSAQTLEPEFTYRKNKDATFDSICMQCYQIVCHCSGTRPEDCTPAELKHKCDPNDVACLRHVAPLFF